MAKKKDSKKSITSKLPSKVQKANFKDPKQLLAAQMELDDYNRVNEQDMFGSSSYTRDPATGQLTRKVNLSPQEQAKLDQEYARQGLVDNYTKQLLESFGGAGANRQKFEDTLYGAATKRLDPEFQQQEERLRQRLADQGVVAGSEKYNRMMNDFNRSRTDAYQQARESAYLGGADEMNRQIGNISGLMSLGQSVRMPQVSATQQNEYNLGQMAATSKALSQRAGGGGGGGGGAAADPQEWYNRAKFQTDESIRRAQAMQAIAQGNKPNQWEQVGGQILAAGAEGFASGAADSFFGGGKK